MENDVLKKKLESLRRCIQRLTDKRPNTVSELSNNYDLQDITVHISNASKHMMIAFCAME